MEQQVAKGVRLPRTLVQRIEKAVKAEGSTFSQFMRTAAIKALEGKNGTA